MHHPTTQVEAIWLRRRSNWKMEVRGGREVEVDGWKDGSMDGWTEKTDYPKWLGLGKILQLRITLKGQFILRLMDLT